MKKLFALVLAVAMMLSMVTFASAEGGKVYYLNFKPEADEAWQALAKTYTELTGVEVKVVTAASGTYSETLTAEMDKGANAPTLFQCGNQAGIETWADFLLDLTGTEFANELTTNEFNLYGPNGELFAVGYCYEAFGIITNRPCWKRPATRLKRSPTSRPSRLLWKTSTPARTSWASTPSPPPVWTVPAPGASPAIWPTCPCTTSSVTTA